MAEKGLDPKWRPSSAGVDVEGFRDVIEGAMVVVHFWAPWNPYDRELDKQVAAVRGAFEKRVRFVAVNVDETAFEPVVEEFSVGALPALLFFVNGRVRGRFHGVQTEEALRAFLTEMASATR